MKNKFEYDFSRYGQPIDNSYDSIISEDHTDRFVLKNKSTGETFACKFFSWENGFVGASFMSIINLNQYFDLTLIERDSSGETYEDYLGI